MANVTPAGSGPNVGTIAVTIGKGKKVAAGRYTLSVDSNLVQDRAGNHLAGTFNGTLPTSGGPGSTFQAAYTVKSNRALKGPIPAVAILGQAHPRNPAVRRLSAAAVAQAVVPQVMLPAPIDGLHRRKAHSHRR